MLVKSIDNFSQVNPDVLVVNLFEDSQTHYDFVNKFVVDKKEFEGKYNTTYVFPTLEQFSVPKVLVLGCGKKEEFNENKVRVLVAKAIKTLAALNVKKVVFDLDFGFDYGKFATMGAYIGNYSFDKYKTKKTPRVEEIYFTKVNPEGIYAGEV